MVPVAFLAGLDTVGETLNDAALSQFVEKTIFEEIVPTLDLPRDELESFSRDVLARFRNPFIKHQLLSIALNGMTKYKTRILPQLLTYQDRKGCLPVRLTFALAALLAFYQGNVAMKPTRCRTMPTGWNTSRLCGLPLMPARSPWPIW